MQAIVRGLVGLGKRTETGTRNDPAEQAGHDPAQDDDYVTESEITAIFAQELGREAPEA